jgi:diguanylate cyclase (GGDEF)-like protein
MMHSPPIPPLGKITRKAKTKRLTVAFFVTELEGDYSESLCKGIIDTALVNDVNLIILPGKTINSTYIRQSHFNVIYEYVNPQNVDALIISSTISNYLSNRQFLKFCMRYQPLPMVSIGVPIEGIPSILVNNRPGLQQVFRHLIQDHGKRRIAFVKGPDGNPDAEERFLVYQDSLTEHGLTFDPDLVIPGDFTLYSADQAVRTLLDERRVSFDAIAAANDEMALAIIKVLQQRNIQVPDDICVTGFDNGRGARYFHPSLTTVDQLIYERGKKALETVLELISSGKATNTVLDTKVIIRESCGCLSETLQLYKTLNINLSKANSQPVEPGQALERFIAELFPEVENITALNKESVRNFVTACFQELTQGQPAEPTITRLLNTFSRLFSPNLLTEDEFLLMQKFITNLHHWINLCSDSRCKGAIANFFQLLRAFLTDLTGKMRDARWNKHRTVIYSLRGLLMDMVTMIQNRDRHFLSLIPGLRSIGIDSCYLYLYDKEIIYRRNHTWHKPPAVNLVMAYNQGWELRKKSRMPWEQVLCHKFLPQDRRYTLLFNPLFITNEQLGLILCELQPHDFLIFESLVFEIGCTLKLAFMLSEREKIEQRIKSALNELEISNQKLHDISQTDELTGLYNRRGFFTHTTQSLRNARETGKMGLLVFADMDGLKNINDSYGHNEGDNAIREIAGILSKTFTSANIIARIGGDEFGIFMTNVDSHFVSNCREQIEYLTAEYNHNSGKPYQLSISMGAVPFQCDADLNIESLMSQADHLLYEQKRLKKK